MKIGLVLVKKQPELKRKPPVAAGEAEVVASTLSNILSITDILALEIS